MKKYFPFLVKYRQALLLGPLLVIMDVLCEIFQPELMSKIVDLGVKEKNLHYILQTGGFMVGLSLVAIAANIGNIYFSSRASVGFAAELRKGLYDRIQQFSFSDIDRFGSASLVTRLTNDVNIVQQVIMMSLRLLIRAPLMLLFAVIIAVRINAGLTLVIAVAIPVLSLSIYLLLRRGLPYFEKMQQRLDRLNAVVQENLVNIRVVKSFVREDFEKKKFGVANTDLRDISIRASGVVVLILPVMQLVMNISIVAIVWFGGKKIIAGSFQVGQLVSFITYITQILMSLMMLSMTIMTFSRAGASSERLLQVLNTVPSILDPAAGNTPGPKVERGEVEFRGVSFKYDPAAGEDSLKNLSFHLPGGQTLAIIGSTGSSKTTLVQLIPRLYEATRGTVLVDGRDVRDYPLRSLRRGVAMVLQQNMLFSGSIRDNIRYGRSTASEDEILDAASIAQAHEFILSLPAGYDTVLGQGGVNISGGQKQRLCLARAIISRPRVLILDDATSAVDLSTEARIRDSLKRNLGDCTIIIIAQRISSVQSADNILLLGDGELIASGNHQQLLASSPVYQEIYHSQLLQNTEAP